MNKDLDSFLASWGHCAEGWPVWSWQGSPVQLQERTFVCTQLPPDRFISSARVVLLRGEEVMVIRDHKHEPYIVPGGRRDPGESVRQTLRRELLEEVGWTIKETAVIGFVHYHHLGVKPTDYPYPYPDFVQAIFTAVADAYHPEAMVADKYVTSSRFVPIAEVLAYGLKTGQHDLLQAALNGRREVHDE